MPKYIIAYASHSPSTPIEGAIRTDDDWWPSWEYETDDLHALILILGQVTVSPGPLGSVLVITIRDDYVE